MRTIFRYLFKINYKYEQMNEPWRMLIFLVPLIISGFLGVLGHFLFNASFFLQFSIYVTFFAMAIFRFPVFFINKDWVYTYIIGWPFKFKYSVQIKYSNTENRKEISKWMSKNIKFYRGVFCPNKGAEFYFARQMDAVAFKLRWI